MRGRIGPIGSLTVESAGTKASQCCQNQCCTGHAHKRCKRRIPNENPASFPQLVTISWMLRHLHPCRKIPTVSKRVGVSAFSRQSENDLVWRKAQPSESVQVELLRSRCWPGLGEPAPRHNRSRWFPPHRVDIGPPTVATFGYPPEVDRVKQQPDYDYRQQKRHVRLSDRARPI